MFAALLGHLYCLKYISVMNGSQLLWTCDAGISCISETLPVLSEGSNGMESALSHLEKKLPV